MAMPGVNLHCPPDFIPGGGLGDPNTLTCAESGLEEVIGDMLVQEELQEQKLWKRRLEVELQSAVCEVHSELQIFGKQLDTRLQEVMAQVAPLAAALAQLQEENLGLRSQQDVLLKKVEALCQAVGAGDQQVKENLNSQVSQKTSADPPSRPQVAAPPPVCSNNAEHPFNLDLSLTVSDKPSLRLQDLDPLEPLTEKPDLSYSPSSPQDHPKDPPGLPNDAQALSDLDVSFTVGEEPSMPLQDLDPLEPTTGELVIDCRSSRPKSNAEDPPGHPKNAEVSSAPDISFTGGGEPLPYIQASEPQPQPLSPMDGMVSHPPTFATCRSLSAPSLMASISINDNMVLTAPHIIAPYFSQTFILTDV